MHSVQHIKGFSYNSPRVYAFVFCFFPFQGTIGGLVRIRRTKRAEVDRDGMCVRACRSCMGLVTAPCDAVVCTVFAAVAGTKKMDELNRAVKEKRAALKAHIDALARIVGL